ncbi:MAG: hypothetical protein ACOYBJ_03440 [Patescibacteria group bacterium]
MNEQIVLVIEDEVSLRKLLCAVLDRPGRKVVAPESPEEVIAALREHAGRIERILLDGLLWGNSWDTGFYNEILRATEGARGSVCLVAISSEEDSNKAMKFFFGRAGIRVVIWGKPFSIRELPSELQ